MNEKIERDLLRQKTSIIVMICIVVMVGMIGFTYSFFAAEISSNSGEITGEVATPELNITVQKVAPVSPNNNKKLIPQLDSAITKAVVGTQGKCVDDNTNAVCQVYKITLKNVSASSINVDGVVELDNGNNPNLKWARISGDGTNSVEPTVIDGIKGVEETSLTVNELYTKGETKEYYIVVWISETGYAQADRGTFTGTVRFNNHLDPSLKTLTDLGLTQYVKNVTPDFLSGSVSVCTYQGNEVLSLEHSNENCRTIYRIKNQDGTEGYIDGFSFETIAIYIGEGIWDDDNLVCMFDGVIVYDSNYEPIANEENCGTVYDFGAISGETLYVSMVKLLEDVEGEMIGDEGIYSMEDDQGTSYYFRGNVKNNYVKFGKYTEDAYAIYDEETGTSSYANSCGGASDCTQIASANEDMYWRIVRINGDGTIRMIYDGTSPHVNGTSSTNRQIGRSTYNKSYNDNAYVGYMYGQVGASTYEATHENNNDSSIKTTIDRWYLKYLNTNYGSNIANAIYCNDRKVVTDDNKYKAWWHDDTKVAGNGVGTSKTLYGTWNRMDYGTNGLSGMHPSLKCEQVNDRFTMQGENIETIDGLGGNQDLIYPVGLITADETILAGGSWNTNENYYLYTGNWYWTGSASYFSVDGAFAFSVLDDGNAPRSNLVYSSYVRAVISLESGVLKYGTGTDIDPFRIEE